MSKSELIHAVLWCVPIVLFCSVTVGIIMMWCVRKSGGRMRAWGVRVFGFCVAMLYLLFFTALALLCVRELLALRDYRWMVAGMAILLLGEIAFFTWCAFLAVLPIVPTGRIPAGGERKREEREVLEKEDEEVEYGMVRQESTEEWIDRRLLVLFENQHIYREYELRIEDVALRIGTNRTYLSSVLNKRHGCGFLKYVNRYRLQEAGELLMSTTWPVCRVADKVGYRNINTFNSCFREHFGLPPARWRKEKMDG